jgi:transposase
MLETDETALVETDSEPKPYKYVPVLKRKQLKAAVLLGQSMSQRDVAKIVRVSEWTVSMWCKLPDFQDAVMEASRADIAEIRATRNRLIREAQLIVEQELKDKASPKRVEIAREVVRSVL